MAAVVEPPRIVRDTTNMERAASAAALRDRRAAPPADRVDPDLIDNSLGDLSTARTFIAAADNFLDEVRRWVRRDGCTPNEPLCREADNAQVMLCETLDKIDEAEVQLRAALKLALQIWSRPLGNTPDPQRFAIAMHHYRMTYLTGQGYYLLNYPGDADDDQAFQTAWEKLVDDTRLAARAVLRTPASCAADMADKQIVIDQQEAIFWNSNEVAEFTRQLIADAIAFAGGAA